MTLHQAILTSLERVAPHLLPESTLHADVNLTLPTPISLTEMRNTLAQMEARRWVISLRDELTTQHKWSIAPQGLSILSQTR